MPRTLMQLVDTHTHLDDGQFDGRLDEIVRRASEAGVAEIVCVGTTALSSVKVVQLAAQYPIMSAAVGIQPMS